MANEYNFGGTDIRTLFQPGSGGAATNYKIGGADLNTIFAPYVSGPKAPVTGYKIAGVDFADRFAKVSTDAPINPVPVTSLGDYKLSPLNPAASLFLYTDGSLSVTGSTSSAGTAWFSTVGGTPGNSYWVKFVLDSGTAWNLGGLTSGTVYALSATRQIGWQRTINGMTTASFSIYIYADAAGTSLVASKTGISVNVERDVA